MIKRSVEACCMSCYTVASSQHSTQCALQHMSPAKLTIMFTAWSQHGKAITWAYQELPSILHLPLWQVCATPAPSRSAPHQSTIVLFAGSCIETGQLSLWKAASTEQTVSKYLFCAIYFRLCSLCFYDEHLSSVQLRFCTGPGQLSLWTAAPKQQTVSHWLGYFINFLLFTILLPWHGCLSYKTFFFIVFEFDPSHDHLRAAEHLNLHLQIEENRDHKFATGTRESQWEPGNLQR